MGRLRPFSCAKLSLMDKVRLDGWLFSGLPLEFMLKAQLLNFFGRVIAFSLMSHRKRRRILTASKRSMNFLSGDKRLG